MRISAWIGCAWWTLGCVACGGSSSDGGPPGAGGGAATGTATTGTGGAAATSGVGGSAGGANGVGGAGGTNGAGGAGGANGAGGAGGAPRELHVDTSSPELSEIRFKPSELDPEVSDRDLEQVALLDTRVARFAGKLVVTLSGSSQPPGPLDLTRFVAARGFHAFAVAYKNDYDIIQNDPDTFGDARLEAFDGQDHTALIEVTRADSIEARLAKALAHLKEVHPRGDWGYFLEDDGSPRWSVIIFSGHSHGASSAARIGKVVRLDRVVSLAGPRDTNPVSATWLSEPSATPVDRMFGLTGERDEQHRDHLKAFDLIGLPGELVEVDVPGAAPPYGGSHRLALKDGDHGAAGNCGAHVAVCEAMFGLPLP
ncbi:BPSS1187 family protein [Sorangium sp. So ce1000]|uniref:BPSS1187 family protein n=1 Tax=Sorangium sp. So ce1000 TaxID=3133325 RepID=UPI003F5E0B09